MKAWKKRRGQALVEFALLLPILLVILVGILEFGRVLFIYVNLFNSAREGARLGIVNPTNPTQIRQTVLDRLILVDPAQVNVTVNYDTGPGTATFTDPNQAGIGARVRVQVQHTARLITPIFQPFAPNGYTVNLISARTIQSLNPNVGGGGGGGGGGGEPTLTPTPQTPTATPQTPTATPQTPTVTPTPTETPPPSGSTPTPSPTPITLLPIVITKPVNAGATQVSGTAHPGYQLTLRVVQTGYTLQTWAQPNGTFTFSGIPEGTLVAGYTILVQGYGKQDLAIIAGPTPTPTPTPIVSPSPTPTPTPGPTATPTTRYVEIIPSCGPTGNVNVTLKWGSWPAPSGNITNFDVQLNGASKVTLNYSTSGSMVLTLGPMNAGLNTILMKTIKSNGGDSNPYYDYTVTYISPCPGTSTPTPTPSPTPTPVGYPNLIVQSVTLVSPPPPIGTYRPVTVQVTIKNIGTADVTRLFWVDLFVDVANPNPAVNPSVDYVAVNGIPINTSISFNMVVPYGFATLGDHTIVVMVDTWNQITESNENDNLSTPLGILVEQANPQPTPTPTVALPPNPGGISGVTRINSLPQGNVVVYVYDSGGRLVWSGISDPSGNYASGLRLAPGTYTVEGRARLVVGETEQLYRATITGVTVIANTVTSNVILDLVQY